MNNQEKHSIEKTNEIMEKRAWVSPEINIWENENIENVPGPGPDGVLQTYF